MWPDHLRPKTWSLVAKMPGLVFEQAGPGIEGVIAEGLGLAAAFQDCGGFGGDADAGQAEFFADFDEIAAHCGVQVHVLMRVGMVEF